MQGIRIIALDMDGTLLDSGKRITLNVQAALREARERGVQCVLSTGRAISELNGYRGELRDVRYWLCESGALIYDSHEDKIIERNTIKESVVLKVLDVLDGLKQDVMVQVMRNGIVEVNEAQVPLMARYKMEAYIPLFSNTASKVKDIVRAIRQDASNIEKMNIYHTDVAEREVTKAALGSLLVEKAYAEETSLELSSIGLSKGSALEYICKMLHINLAQTAAVGDSGNDITILKTAAVPIAMGNATSHIKSLCTLTVSDCDHDGCAEAIRAVLC